MTEQQVDRLVAHLRMQIEKNLTRYEKLAEGSFEKDMDAFQYWAGAAHAAKSLAASIGIHTRDGVRAVEVES